MGAFGRLDMVESVRAWSAVMEQPSNILRSCISSRVGISKIEMQIRARSIHKLRSIC